MSRAWQMVTCDLCRETSQCTPSNDFYEGGVVVPAGKVACERCFRNLCRAVLAEEIQR